MPAISFKRTGVMDAAYARDRVAKRHLAFRLRVRAQVVARAVRRFSRASAIRLLEVGAAEGQTLVEMAGFIGPGEYIGVEYDDALLSAHPCLPENIRLIRGDALALPRELGEGCFDVVSLLAILEHLPDPLAALREARRVLRPGGFAVITCPNPFWDAAAERFGLANASSHVRQIDLAKMCQLVKAAKFEIVAARRFMWAPIAVLPYARIPVSSRFALNVDEVIDRIPFLRVLCVNAYVVAQRPKDAQQPATTTGGRASNKLLPVSG